VTPLRTLSLFAGIGGFDLGLERTGGFRTDCFCEIDDYCREVLVKRWPGVPIHADVRNLTKGHLKWVHGVRTVDVICGGFPCQDISSAGAKQGISGGRSGLWSEFARLIGELRPKYVIVENVADLLSRGLGDVLGDLAALGYDAEWNCISAAHIGAPHIRDRLWIVAYPHSKSEHAGAVNAEMARVSSCLADAFGARQPQQVGAGEAILGRGPCEPSGLDGGPWDAWLVEPDVGRVAHGVPARVDRLRCLGNAIVPQIAQIIGNAILQAEAVKRTTAEHEQEVAA